MRVGILGFGNMGSAFGRCLKEAIVYDINEEKKKLALSLGLGVANDLEFLKGESELILVAVKPKDKGVLENFKDYQGVIVSIMAGVSIKEIEKLCGRKKIVRFMPNINVLVGEALIGYSKNELVDENLLEEVLKTFKNCGSFVEVREELMDSFTALCGSSPALIFELIDALILAGLREGFDYKTSREIAVQILLGSAKLVKEFEGEVRSLTFKVVSPAGTTAEMLTELERRAFKSSIVEAVRKATQRAKELSKR